MSVGITQWIFTSVISFTFITEIHSKLFLFIKNYTTILIMFKTIINASPKLFLKYLVFPLA